MVKYLFFLLLIPVMVFAQSYSIEGYVIDSTSTKLPAVNVVVYSNQQKFLSGTTTDKDGKFNLRNIKEKQVSIKFSSIGYSTKTIDTLLNDKEINLGNITLQSSTILMSEVTVKSYKPMIEYQADKKVVNVDQVPAAYGSVSEALGTTGLVDVDPVTKKISIRGKGVNIQIDGKPAPMGDEMITQLPAESIEQVEVITNPSAKDDPEGGGYIVNLITKKGMLDALSGSVSLTGSTNETGYGGIRLNYKTGKWNFYSNYNGSLYQMGFNNNSNRRIYDNPKNNDENSKGDFSFKALNSNVKLSVDYDLDEYNFFSIGGNYVNSNNDGSGFSDIYMFNNIHEISYYTLSKNAFNNVNNEYRGTAYYKHKFDKLGHEFTFDGLWFTYKRTQGYDYDNTFSYNAAFPEKLRTDNHVDNTTSILKAEYVNPLSFGKLEAGYHFTYRDRKNDLQSLNYNYGSNQWLDSLNQSNVFNYNENIHAAYLSFGHTINSFGYKAGIRAEKVFDEGILESTTEKFNNDYISFYPSLNLFYKLSDMFNINLNAGRKVNRPFMDWINPFKRTVQHNIVSIGNPNIKPTYTNLFEFQIGQFINAYYNFTTGDVDNVETMLNDSVIAYTWVNLAKNKTYGVELTLPYYKSPMSPIQFMPDFIEMFYVKLNYNKSQTEGRYGTENLSTKTNNFNMSANLSLGLWWDIKANAFLWYQPKTTNEREVRYAYNNLTFSLRRSFWDNKLRVGLTFNNILNSKGWRFENISSGTRMYMEQNQKIPQYVSLNFTYMFNNFKDKSERNIDDGRDSGGGNNNGGM